jgi:hypothetical protein
MRRWASSACGYRVDRSAVMGGATGDGRAGRRPGRVEIGCAFQCGPWISHGGRRARVDVEANGATSDRGGSVLRELDDAPLPLGYGSDRLELMVRDPTSAHAYWDLSSDRIDAAIGPHEGGRAFLRLIGVPSGYLLAEYAVPVARGSQDVGLPEADSLYVVELAVMRDYRWVVLARSDVIHAPPSTPRVAPTPAVVSGAQRSRVVAEGDGRELERAGGDVVVAPAEGARHVAQMGSEARLVGVGSEFRLASELRSAQGGSEARLTRRAPAHMPFVIAGRPGLPEPVAVALGALAAAVWLGRDPVDVLSAGSALAAALADAGISTGAAVAILDPPGPGVAAPEPAGRYASRPGTGAYTVSENVDGSVTVIDRDGNSVTYSPVRSADGESARARSVAAIVGGRDAL